MMAKTAMNPGTAMRSPTVPLVEAAASPSRERAAKPTKKIPPSAERERNDTTRRTITTWALNSETMIPRKSPGIVSP